MNFVSADTFKENFDSGIDGSTINQINGWEVLTDDVDLAVLQSLFVCNGKALELKGKENVCRIVREDSYGNVSPCWIEYKIKPGIGGERASFPAGKIAAVSFDYTGKVYASNGTGWVNTGLAFSPANWYVVDMKLNFAEHAYDLYVTLLTNPEQAYNLIKTDLKFIDSTINTLSKIGFQGAYSVILPDESYIDDLIVHFVNRLRYSSMPAIVAKDTVSAPITVQLANSQNSSQTAWKDITLDMKTTSTGGQFSINYEPWIAVNQIIIPAGSQEAVFYYKDTTKGKPILTLSEVPDMGWDDAAASVEVVDSIPCYDIVVDTPQISGQQFDVEIIAKDRVGSIDKAYTGSLDVITEYVNPDAGYKSIFPNQITGFVDGKVKTNLTYADCGIVKLKIQDTVDRNRAAASGEILFLPNKFILTPSAALVSAGENFRLKLEAVNYQGEICSNYFGSVSLLPIAVFPADVSNSRFTPTNVWSFIEGTRDIDIAYNLWGTIKIQAQDETFPAQKGESEEMKFQPASVCVDVKFSESRRFFYTGEKFTAAISCLDKTGALITNYQGKISMSSSMHLNIPAEYTFLPEDNGVKAYTMTAQEQGEYKIWAQDNDSRVKGESPAIEVKTATLIVNPPPEAPVGVVEVPIQLIDENGSLIVDNEVYVTIVIDEENNDSSAYSTAVDTPVQLINGTAKIIVGNGAPEMVTITPVTTGSFKFNIKKGSIRFGRGSKTGIGSLIWREIKQ